MYENHFSFKHKPFELIPNPDFLFLSHSHKKAVIYLDYGVKERIGFILLTGEVGSGKTTIIRNLIKNLDGSVKLSKINNTKVSSEQLISMINEDFGLDIKGKDKTVLLSELNGFLIDQYAKGFQPILLIDEAQNLTPDLLEEIRLLSNLETDRAKLLQIILVGQPELKETLMHPNLRQLRQRITINYHITPLTREETGEYIKHRLTIAGNTDVINFKEDMLDIIYQFSRGIPRLINILCDFVLLATYVEGDKVVSVDMVREIAKDLEARNYWNESLNESSLRQNTVSETTQNGKDLLQTAGEVTLRLAKTDNKITELLERVSNLERICPLFEYKEKKKRLI
jgi:putative secretion ATPase (PEP-CTERM system associated)